MLYVLDKSDIIINYILKKLKALKNSIYSAQIKIIALVDVVLISNEQLY